ncbi:caspase family protein [Rubrimonas cliftonensis]|uniref:Caspase domain-containing protein n=1 Tax=Rubrimonas cliftonensis TaxID=89524 RepID=A0A1H4B8I0_9RHOB|nr:caspase family protein [Rubrimonas cliftonensis]SEA44449.1 Caspase domain-containing protein [Rubrimonas cliftonensis]
MADKVALLIGNSVYEHARLARLSAPSADVIALREALGDKAIAGFETELLLNAGLDEARAAINRLFANRHPDDTVLLYYSGHGVRDAHGDLYLALPRTDPDDPSPMSLDADFIRKRMSRSGSRRQVLMLDCCHSGAFQPGAKSGGSDLLVRTDFDPGGHGRFVLAASGAEESAFEVDGRSIFTRHVVDALKNGEAAAEREFITINDLHRYVARRAPDDNPAMRPRLWVDDQTTALILARNPNPRRPLPADAVAALWESDLYGALGAAARLWDMAEADPRMAADVSRQFEQRLARLDDLNVIVADWLRQALARPAGAEAASRAEAAAAALRGELASAREAGKAAEAEAAGLRRECDEAREALAAAQAEAERGRARAAQEAKERSDLAAAAELRRVEIAQLQNALSRAEGERETLRGELARRTAGAGEAAPATFADRLWGARAGGPADARRTRLRNWALVALGIVILLALAMENSAPVAFYPVYPGY